MQGIIFDFNGTLFRDSQLHSEAWRRMALKLRGSELTDDELTQHIHGRINPAIIQYITGQTLDDQTVLELSLEKEQIYRELCLDGFVMQLAPGAEELLDFLKEHEIPRAIATSSESTNLDFYLKSFPLERWFSKSDIVYDDGTLPGKPAPDIYLRAAKRLDLSPKQCVVVEDAVSGIRSAHRAGIGLIVAVGPPETHADLSLLNEVDRVIDDLMELKPLFL